MLDIKDIVAKPKFYQEKLKNRIDDTDVIFQLISLDKKRSQLIHMENFSASLKNSCAKIRGRFSFCRNLENERFKDFFSTDEFSNINIKNIIDLVESLDFPAEFDQEEYLNIISSEEYKRGIEGNKNGDLLGEDFSFTPLNKATYYIDIVGQILIWSFNYFANERKIDNGLILSMIGSVDATIEKFNFLFEKSGANRLNDKRWEIEKLKNLREIIESIKIYENFDIDKGKKDLESFLQNVDRCSAALSYFISYVKSLLNKINNDIKDIISYLPNITLEEVHSGKGEDDNIEISCADFREKKLEHINDFKPKTHDVIAENLNLIEQEKTVLMSGSRFVSTVGDLAKLEMSLGRMFIEYVVGHGYNHVSPPCVVSDNAMYGAGQLPKFHDESYKVEASQRLIPTSEVPLVNMFADSILKQSSLPIRCTALTPCFRLEAGSSGKDTKGLIRLHQFSKVEIISVTDKDSSQMEFERMINIVSSLINELKLKYRIVRLCDGDTGFSSALTYDFEIWMPGQNAYREVSSCSNCTSFQARRMKTRYKDQNSQKNIFAHTLNGSCLAIGRVIAAILETYQCEDGSVDIPSSLIPYFGSSKIYKRSAIFV